MTQTYEWRPATGMDIDHIVQLAQQHFEHEIDDIFTPDPLAFAHQLTRAVVDQFYNPNTVFVRVARSTVDNTVLAYTWAQRGEYAVWSRDEMVAVKMAHVNMHLPNRQRIAMITEMIMQWIEWCEHIGVPVLTSTTMRHDQAGFLRLHERMGFSVRGSIAYKKMEK